MTELEKQGMALKEMRKRSNMTLEETVKHFGRSKVWLSEIENGMKNIYFGDAKKLCRIYGCSVDDLVHLIDTY